MSRNVKSFAMTAQRIKAATLLAEDDLTDAEIALRVGVTHRQFARWKLEPEFQERVAQIVDRLAEDAVEHAIGRRSARLAALQGRWELMQRVIKERGEDPTMAEVPGGTTGLLVKEVTERPTRTGPIVTTKYEVDTGLLSALLNHEKQAAIETGQWTEKRELTGKDGGPLEVSDVKQRLTARIAAKLAERSAGRNTGDA